MTKKQFFFSMFVTRVVFLTLFKVPKDFGCHCDAKIWETFDKDCFD